MIGRLGAIGIRPRDTCALCTALAAVLAMFATGATLAVEQRPNFVVFLADDLGAMDIGANNPKTFYETPNIDALAASGMRMTQGYAACPVCSPTRASIMTGKYPPRVGVTDYIGANRPGKLLPAPNQKYLALAEVTIAEQLRDAGYSTFFAGKWHLGDGEYSPNAQGFGPGLTGGGQFYYPAPPPDADPKQDPQDDPKQTDRIAEAAVRFIESHPDQPFFASLPFLAVHIPIGARHDLVEKFQAKRAAAPPAEVWGQEGKSKLRRVQNHAAYAAMLKQMDDAVGRVLAAIDRAGVAERTVVVFVSDNGGLSTAEGHPTSNLPLRAGKGWLYEGGTRIPWIVRAPGFTKAGSTCDTPVVTTDLYPTFLELARLPPAPQQHRDGVSLVPLLKGGEIKARPLFWHYPHYGNQGGAPGGAVRDGDWKLIEWYEDGRLELFNLRDDAGETNNVAAQHPERVKRLHAALRAWRDEVKAVMPTPNPRAGEPSAPPKQALRPNILFCFADDWGRFASAYAALDARPSPNQVVKTPNIDRVAREGVLFRNAFVPAPSCTPCRSSLLSGQYFFRTGRGAILTGARWNKSIPSFPLLLAEAGYDVGETWKVWSPGTPVDAPFGAGKYGYESAGSEFNNFSQNVTRAVREGVSLEAAKQRLYAEVRGNFDAFLAARRAGQPFCYWFGPTLVHRTWVKGSGKALWGIDPDSLAGKLPKFLPDVPEVREDFADYLGEIQAFDAAVGVLIKRLQETGELDRTLIVISGDHGPPGFPGGKCNLYDFGVAVALVARWPGGSVGADRKGGRVVDDFVNLMDLAPTFLEVAGVKPPQVMTGRSFAEVLRSDRAGQVDARRTWVVTGRERHVGAARQGNLPYPQRALRTKDYLYIRNFAPDRWPLGDPKAVSDADAPAAEELARNTRAAFADMDASPTKAWLIGHRNDPQWKWHNDYAFARRPGEELYDLRKDPEQTANVAADAAYADTKRELAARLLKTLEDAGDPRVRGDGTTFDMSPFSDPEPARPAPRQGRTKTR